MAQELTDLERRLSVIEMLASQIRNCRWTFSTSAHSLRSADDLAPLHTKPEFTRGTVFIEPSTGRHRVEFEKVGRWIDGVTPWLGKTVAFAFDGQVFRIRKRIHHGAELPGPSDLPGFGRIQTQPDDFFPILGLETGLAFLPPYLWTQSMGIRRLVDVLRSNLGQGLEIVESPSDPQEWNISFPDGEDVAHLRYSLANGGFVVEATWGLGTPRLVWRRIIADALHELPDCTWAPTVVSMVDRLDRPPDMVRVEYSNVRLNSTVDDDTFRVAFLSGMLIDDVTNGQRYVA